MIVINLGSKNAPESDICLAYVHWRQSALNSAGAIHGGDGESRGIFTPFYTINFRGGRKSGGAHATVASPSLAPLHMCKLTSQSLKLLLI